MSEIIKMAEGSMSEIELAEENMSEIEMAEKNMSGKKMAKGKMSGKEMPEDETSETKKAKKKMSWKKIAKKKRSWKKIPKGMSWKKIAWRPEFKKDLPSFSAIVSAAESKAYENREVKWWFDELKEVMYDRDDLQDEIDTKRLRRRLENKPKNIRTWLRELISTTLIERRWKEIVARIEDLQIQNEMLGLPFHPFDKRSTTTYAPTGHTQLRVRKLALFKKESFQEVYGRNEDGRAIINLLLSDDVYADHMDVIPIVGMSGVGKTTLAGLVYKDYTVSKHFDLKGWVYVSDDFDVFRFTKTLLEVFTGHASDIKDVSDLQVKLKEILYMKKCLLVLDDVCCEDSSVLAMMCEPLLAGAKGSKIIVTTQSASVASKMGTRTAHCLNPLRYEDSWMLFAKHAYHNAIKRLFPELEATGKQIVTKCDGLPLAIVTLGAMLRHDLTIDAWKAVLMKIPYSCRSDFIPVLLISYNSLPAHLKPCFAYCSIFPKDYEYEKEELVLLWMAEGLLPHEVDGFDRKPEIEEVGRENFDDLTSRCFFQQSSVNKSRFVMHPAMNDLARSVSGGDSTWQKRFATGQEHDYLVPVVKKRFEDDFQVVYGRDKDQKAIIKLLLSDDVYADHMDVIPIVGVSGVGKTTLAGLVYKDYRASKHFDLKGWVYVSDDFDVFRFTKTLLEVFTGQTSDIKDLSDLQDKLKESLNMKKCLLVLDDVCCEDSSVLAMMCEPLLAGAKGSKIVVTTRSASVASKMGTRLAHCLNPLRYEDSWMLFAKHAFDDKNNGSFPELEATGKQIVTKCDGLPLAIVTLGAMLPFDLTIHAWEAVLMKTPDSCTSDFIPFLLISYNSLPAHLKPCFAYCSIFPKDYEYEKEKLVLLWMAEGLLQHVVYGFGYFRTNTRTQIMTPLNSQLIFEEVGLKYFDYLTSLSFFQQSSANKSRFVMHPAMNDLARLVSGDFCSRLVNNESQKVSPKVRHLSFSGYLNAERCEAICQETKFVRTLLPYKLPVAESACQLSELEDLFMALRHLRVLSLSHYHITELPDSIKKLKLLRYLDLSDTAITRFPDTVSTLYNLQTLLLSCCHSLAELPKNMGNLVNLRHLDIRETCLEEMPAKMGFLTNLRSLSNFVVGKDSGSKIIELGPLSNLQGTLHISQLQNVVSAGDACEVELKNKAGLQMLGLEWSDDTVSSQNQTEVLQQLEPHKNLEKLSIISYGGKSFPSWLGDSSSKMVFLHLSNCNSCSHLPPLGQLASLKELKIERMNRVKLVGLEFYGWNYSRVKPFPSLERLSFQEMLEWKEWISPPKIEGEEFPSLKWIRISGCPKLAKHLHLCLPPSAEVEISDSPLLKVPVRDDLQLHDGDKMQFEDDDMVAGRPPMHRTEISSQPLEHRTDVPSTSHSSPPESSKLLTELAPSKLPVIVEKQLHEGHKTQFRRNEELLDRPSNSREVESSQLVDSYEVLGTDVSMTKDSGPQLGGASDNSPAATARSSDTDIDDPINVWYDEESLDGNSSPEQESLNVSEISQLKRLPPKLQDLKIEGSDALESLPEELMHNNNRYLRRLYIIGCHFLKSIHARSLPNALKTLYISKCEKLEFLFSEGRISEHTSLEHLCIESSCDSLNSFPLDFFPKLRSLFIQGCANFNSISIGSEDHKYLDALEIRDCAQLRSFPEGGLRIPNLTSILLSNCKNLKALPGQLHSLTSLQSLFINECPELESIPEGGLPSSLNLFCIRSCHKLTPRIEWGLHQLNNFSRIEIEGGCRDLESFPEQNLLPMKLNSLQISRFPNLKILNYKGLQHLTSLETLKINSCGELQSLSEEGLPSSLSYLYISDCPLLKSKLHNKREEWYKIAHIPHIQIDGKVIS